LDGSAALKKYRATVNNLSKKKNNRILKPAKMFVMITSSCAENIETRYQEKDKGIAFDDNEQ